MFRRSIPPDHVPGAIEHYCSECHNTTDWAGGLALNTLDPAHVHDDAESWEKVVRKLRAGMMPPPGKPRPARADAEAIASLLETRLYEQSGKPIGGESVAGGPGPAPALHRLNRTEYANTQFPHVLAYARRA